MFGESSLRTAFGLGTLLGADGGGSRASGWGDEPGTEAEG